MEKILKSVNFPVGMLKKIEQYQKEYYLASFTAAVVELVRKGLEK